MYEQVNIPLASAFPFKTQPVWLYL
uniref:Uncharacterized protein n=1 Tax=Anguilla anguilla TaxID=7936 RepID=A0A0E9PPL1_ANGAN